MRFKATVAYDGSGYHGFARQEKLATVEQTLGAALTAVLGGPVRIWYASRTDAGVHARGQTVAFDTDKKIPNANLCRAVNGRLPPDIRISGVRLARPGFNPRHEAEKKRYAYSIDLGRHDPLRSRFFWQYGKELDVAAMRRAAQAFLGTHDFLSFSTSEQKDTVRTLTKAAIARKGDTVSLVFEGKGFLRTMVRMMVGTLVAVGEGTASKEKIERMLRRPVKGSSVLVAPACGLCLEKTTYRKLR